MFRNAAFCIEIPYKQKTNKNTYHPVSLLAPLKNVIRGMRNVKYKTALKLLNDGLIDRLVILVLKTFNVKNVKKINVKERIFFNVLCINKKNVLILGLHVKKGRKGRCPGSKKKVLFKL